MCLILLTHTVSPPTTQQRNEPPNDMSDSGSSRSRRRKRSNHKGKRPIPPAVEETTYRVESPKTVQKRKSPLTKKSKSLDDDDDSIQIREVCETSECSAVEDDSDPIIWEVAEDMNVNQIQNETVRITTTQTLKLEDKAQLQSITPEDETKLRCFLEGLRLVSTPEEAADRAVQSRESAESIKARRAKKREELAQYFLPVYQNPRFLDVISEENSDQSDKEQKERGSYGNSTPTTQKTVITEMDSARIPIISDTCTTSIAQTGSSVEIVYLEDSSGCESESAESIEDTDAKIDVKDVLSSQLTPPPTPDEKLDEIRRISKETVMQNVFGNTQIQCFNLHEIESDNKAPLLPMHRVNVVSPSHLSECSGDSSSRGTSLCTTIYREELPNEMLSLRELCLKKLISLPFGRDILEELASVSESLEELTNNLSSSHQLHHNNNRTVPASSSVKLTQNTTEDRINTSDDFDISAASPMVSTKTKPAPKEAVGAKNLLDLHEKFAQIRGNHQNTVDESSNSSRLLALIRGTDSSESTAVESGGHVQEQQRTLEERSGDEARLDARNLSEWLNLARAKSGSVPHLNNLDNMKDPLPKPDGITTRRRRSLPQEIYIQQMQYLIQKEKEIQQELEKLEEEKRKLASEMNTTDDQHHFDPSQYKISKNQDIAIHQPNPNKSTIPPASERFRQNMYDEYMTQIAKRQDRQQHKVIKISSHQIPTTESRGKLEAIHVKGIEDEFMNKVKQRKLKYAATTSEDSADYASLPERSDAEDSEPVLVMDGDSLSEAKRLPKHLKEFVAITREAACNLDTEDGESRTKRLELQWLLCDLLNVLTNVWETSY